VPPMPERGLQVRVDGDEDYSVVEAHGDVDLASAPYLGTILRAITHRRDATVAVDLRPANFLGSAGISTLIASYREASRISAPFEVHVRSGSQPEMALRMAGVQRLFSVIAWEAPLAEEVLDEPGMAHGSLELRIPANVLQVSRVRHLTEQVLALARVDDGWIGDFVTAIGEAVANAVTHGSPEGSPGYVIFSLKPGSSNVTAEVQDFGRGIDGWNGVPRMPSPGSLRGRGLGMMSLFSDHLEVCTGETGTLIRIQKRLDPVIAIS